MIVTDKRWSSLAEKSGKLNKNYPLTERLRPPKEIYANTDQSIVVL